MTEKLQRTERVITEAELRTMLGDEDADSFADVISKASRRSGGVPGVVRRTAVGASGKTRTGRIKTEPNMRSYIIAADVRFGSLADKPSRPKIHRCPFLSESGHWLVANMSNVPLQRPRQPPNQSIA